MTFIEKCVCCWLMVFMLCICVGNNLSAESDQCKICGNWSWEKNDDLHDFTLQLYLQDSLVIGKHCYVLNSGVKMDCAAEPSDVSFKLKLPIGDSLQVNVKSFYSGQAGMVMLKLVGNKIHWQLIKTPEGEYYLPGDAFLVRAE